MIKQNLKLLSASRLLAPLLIGVLAGSPMVLQAAPGQAVVGATAAEVKASVININTAGVEALADLHGVGAAKAQAIIDYRSKFGAFRNAEDLLAVEGIGQATLTKNLGRISL